VFTCKLETSRTLTFSLTYAYAKMHAFACMAAHSRTYEHAHMQHARTHTHTQQEERDQMSKHVTQTFDFAEYLSLQLGEVLGELVEVWNQLRALDRYHVSSRCVCKRMFLYEHILCIRERERLTFVGVHKNAEFFLPVHVCAYCACACALLQRCLMRKTCVRACVRESSGNTL